MAAIDFPTATSNGQTFEADSGVIYTYVGTPPNGFWSGTFGTTGLTTLDGRYIAKNDENTLQTIQTQGLKFNSGSSDTILLDGVNGNVSIGTATPLTSSGFNGVTASGSTGGIYWFAKAGAQKGYIHGQDNDVTLASTDASGVIRLLTGGNNERMRIDSSGNVGIGTTSPSYALDVKTSAETAIRIDSGSGNNAILRFAQAGVNKAFIQYPNGGGLTFGPAGSEAARIDSSGRLLVGTSSTSEVSKVVFQGNSTISTGTSIVKLTLGNASPGSTDELGKIQFADSSHVTAAQIAGLRDGGTWNSGSRPSALTFSTTADGASAPTERMRIDSSGNVGIGNTNPGDFRSGAENLVVGSGSGAEGMTIYTANNASGRICFADGSGASDEERGVIQYAHDDNHMQFNTNALERIRITSDGKVGIGTTSPAYDFVISNGGAAGLEISPNQGVGGGAFLLSFNRSTLAHLPLTYYANAHVFETGTGASITERARIDGFGRILVGTSSSASVGDSQYAKLQIKANNYSSSGNGILSLQSGTTTPSVNNTLGTILFADNTGGEYGRIDCSVDGGAATNNYPGRLSFSTTADGASSPTERMRIDNAGNAMFGKTHTNQTAGTGAFFVTGINTQLGLVIDNTSSAFTPITLYNVNATNNGFRFYVRQDGGVANFQVNDINISDINVKKDISPATGTWNCIKEWEIVNFRYKDQPDDADLNMGVIAQQIAESCPEVVTVFEEGTENQPEKLGVKEQQMMWMAIKALQEAIAKIETLEAVDRDQFQNTSTLLNQPLITFLNSSGATAGEIIHSGVNSVTYATSSDHRLKENVIDLTAAIPRLKNLAPKRFNFIGADEVTVDGFLAHEAQTVVPEAVTGTHNEVDGDGNAVMQGIDQSKLVPLLTAALQEAIAKIETLETKVAALEAA